MFGLTEARMMAGHACPAQSSARRHKGGLPCTEGWPAGGEGWGEGLPYKQASHGPQEAGEEEEEKRVLAQYLPFEV